MPCAGKRLLNDRFVCRYDGTVLEAAYDGEYKVTDRAVLIERRTAQKELFFFETWLIQFAPVEKDYICPGPCFADSAL